MFHCLRSELQWIVTFDSLFAPVVLFQVWTAQKFGRYYLNSIRLCEFVDTHFLGVICYCRNVYYVTLLYVIREVGGDN